MKSLLLLSTCITCCIIVNAQNIIPNADWELGPAVSTDYPTGWAVDGPDDWVVTDDSPDRIYWGSLAAFRDNDSAQSGLAYVMFYGPYNEAGMCTLNTPIVAGNTYHLTYYLDVDDNFDTGPGAIAFRFIGGDSIVTPYAVNTGDWQYFDTVYTASSGATELELIGVGGNLTKIDNIVFTEEKSTDISEISGEDPLNVFVFPNPFTTSATITINQPGVFDLILYDALGREVEILKSEISLPAGQAGKFEIERGDLRAGVYFYKVEEEGKMIASGKLVVE